MARHHFEVTIQLVLDPNGPAGHDLQLVNEQSIDKHLVNIRNIASDDFTVELVDSK